MRLSQGAEVGHLFRLKLASLRAEEATPRRRRPRRRITVPVQPPADDALLSTGQVAALLGMSSPTVLRWKLPCRFTLGGVRRYRWGEVRAQLERDF